MIERLAIIGVGLIGGSLALALKQAGAVRSVVGFGRGAENLAAAQRLGIVDDVATSIGAAVTGADVVVLAVPVGNMAAAMHALAPMLTDDTVITDVGSAKASVLAAARAALGERLRQFVPGHPIAGTEKSGAGAAFADLFRAKRRVLTPLAATNAQALAQVEAMWRHAGAQIMYMDADAHDEIFAMTSHLPHVLAYTLVGLLARGNLRLPAEANSLFDFAAGGFRDLTRIAGSDPTMWRDICLANSSALRASLDRFQHELEALAQAIERGDGAFLLERFHAAKAARDAHVKDLAP